MYTEVEDMVKNTNKFDRLDKPVVLDVDEIER